MQLDYLLGVFALMSCVACSTRSYEPTAEQAAKLTVPEGCPTVGSPCKYDPRNPADGHCLADAGAVGIDCFCASNGQIACTSTECALDGGVIPSECCACLDTSDSGPTTEFACLCPSTVTPSGCNNPNGVGDDNGKCKGHYRDAH